MAAQMSCMFAVLIFNICFMSVTKPTSEVNMITSNLLHDIRKIISLDNYIVLIYLVSLNKIGAISISDSLSNDDFKENLLAQLRNSEFIKNVNPLFNDVFYTIINRLSHIELNNLLCALKDFSIEDHLFSEFFEDLIYKISLNQGRAAVEYMQPLELTHFIMGLISNDQGQKIYNPFAGIASFGVNMNEKDSYYGQELVPTSWGIGLLRLIINGKDHQNYVCNDSVTNWLGNSQKFDLIVANPPFNVRLHERVEELRNLEDFLITKGYQSLSSNGRLITILPAGFLYRDGQDQRLRKELVDGDLIDTIISLPTGLFHNTGIATIMLVLNKNKKHPNKVKFFNGQDYFFKNGARKVVLDHVRLLQNLGSDKEIYGEFNFVDVRDIVFNEYNLNSANYFFNAENIAKSANLDPSQQLVNLADILLNVDTPKSVKGSIGKVIRIKDLSTDIFLPQIDISLLQDETLDKPFSKITGKILLLSKRFNNLKPSFVEATKSNPVYISTDIFAFEVPDSIDIYYLIWQLGSDLVKKQLEAFTTGAIMPSITAKNLLKIIVQLPTLLSEQKSLYFAAKLQADKDKITENNLQGTIDNLIKDRFEEFQWDLHDIRNSELLAITQQAQILSKIMQRNPEVASTIVDPRNNIKLQDYMEKLLVNTKALAKKISTIYEFATAQEQFEVFDIVSFVENFMKTQEHLDLGQLNYEFITDNIQEIYELGLSIQVKFNKADLTRILNNIVENVKRHASFNPENPSSNKFSIAIEVPASSQVKISFLNSGDRSDVTPSMYFSRDRKWGKTGNSGMGGYAIKKLANRNSAQVEMETFAEGEYVFGVSLLINRAFEYVL